MFLQKTPYAIRLILPILWYGLIFFLTELPAANPLETKKSIENLGNGHDWIIYFSETLNAIFRTSSHVFFFGVLGILIYYVIQPSFLFQATKFWLTILLVILLAISDELHQFYVPNRHLRAIDVAKDTLGALVFVWVTSKFSQILHQKRISGNNK